MSVADLPPLPFDDVNPATVAVAPDRGTAPISLKAFFETIPPGRSVVVANALTQQNNFSPPRYHITNVEIDLHCDTPVKCGGIRSFEKITKEDISGSGTYQHSVHVRFRCRNCRQKIK